MKYLTVEEFVENINQVIEDALVYEEMANIETAEGDRVVLMTENQYECLIEAMAKKHAI